MVTFAADPIAPRRPATPTAPSSNPNSDEFYSLSSDGTDSHSDSTRPLESSRSGSTSLVGRHKPAISFASTDPASSETDSRTPTRTEEQLSRAEQFKRKRRESDLPTPTSRWSSLRSYLPSFTREHVDPTTDTNTAANKTIGTESEASRVKAPARPGCIKNWTDRPTAPSTAPGARTDTGTRTGPATSSRPTQMTGPSECTDNSTTGPGVYLHSTSVQQHKGFEKTTNGTDGTEVFTIYAPEAGVERGRRAYRVPTVTGEYVEFVQEWDHSPTGMTHMLSFGGRYQDETTDSPMSKRQRTDTTSGPSNTSNTPSGSSVHPYMSLAKSLNDSGYSIAGTVSELAQMYDTSRNYILNTFLSAASAAADRYGYAPGSSTYPVSLARDALSLTHSFLSRTPGPEPTVSTGTDAASAQSQVTHDQWTLRQREASSAVDSCLTGSSNVINPDDDIYSSMYDASAAYDHASMSGVWTALTDGARSRGEEDARSLAGLESYMTMMGGIRRGAVQQGIPPPERTTANQRDLISSAISDAKSGCTSHAASYLDSHVKEWQRSRAGSGKASTVGSTNVPVPPRRVQFAGA